jgi:hypothetical protein
MKTAPNDALVSILWIQTKRMFAPPQHIRRLSPLKPDPVALEPLTLINS